MKRYRLKKEISKGIKIAFISILTCLILLEAICFFLYRIDPPETELNQYYFLGKTYNEGDYSIKNSVKLFRENDSVVYNATYILDKYGRRKNIVKSVEHPHLILFGGSYTLGAGLKDDETLAYFLSNRSNFRVYNYGNDTFGTSNMLYILESRNLSKEIENKTGIALYIFIPHHIRRNIMDLEIYNTWGQDNPYYHLTEQNKLEWMEFEEAEPLRSFFYKIFWKSNIRKYFDLDLPRRIREEHIFKTYKIIERSREEYLSEFDGKFYVVIHPIIYGQSKNYLKLIYLLEKNNISVINPRLENIDYSKPLGPENYSDYVIIGEFHPNKRMNDELSTMILNKIGYT